MDASGGTEDTASSNDSIDVQLQILPNKLRIGRIPQGALSAAALPLLKLVLFPAEDRSRFVSMTHTSEELSVIIDEEDLASFPPNVLQLGEKTFRALQVSEGSTGVTTVGIVQYLSVPLAAAGVSIFYLSTYETDFTLIAEENLSQALDVVQKHFVGADIDMSDIGTLPEQKMCIPNDSPPHRHPIILPPGDLYLASIKRDQLPSMGTYIMNLIFHTGPTQYEEAVLKGETEDLRYFLVQAILGNRSFFSYTETQEEVSLILNNQTAAIFPPETINLHTEGWRLLKVDFGDKPLGFEETGIVSSIADPLASAKISLFYISTYSTDYPLVPASDVARAAQVLAAAKFDITSS